MTDDRADGPGITRRVGNQDRRAGREDLVRESVRRDPALVLLDVLVDRGLGGEADLTVEEAAFFVQQVQAAAADADQVADLVQHQVQQRVALDVADERLANLLERADDVLIRRRVPDGGPDAVRYRHASLLLRTRRPRSSDAWALP